MGWKSRKILGILAMALTFTVMLLYNLSEEKK